MAVDVVMPQMGVSVSEGTISRWVKGVGEAIEADETIVEISTDKVDTEVPSPGAGVITEILHQEGETVPVGTRIAVIGGEAAMAEASAQAVAGAASSNDAVALEADGPPTVPAPSPEAPGTAPESPAAAATAQAASGSVDAAPAVASEPAPHFGPATSDGGFGGAEAPTATNGGEGAEGRSFMSPVVARMVAEHGLDIARIPGTGRGGRVTKKDVEAFLAGGVSARSTAAPAVAPAPVAPQAPAAPAAAAPAATPTVRDAGPLEELYRFSTIRRAISKHMRQSIETAAQVTSVIEVDMTRVVGIRKELKPQFQQTYAVSLSYLPFILRAVIDAIGRWPWMNAEIQGDQAIIKKYVHMGIAVAVDDAKGLLVPVIKNAEEQSLVGLSRAIVDLADRARKKQLTVDEMTGATFTVTNPGVFGALIGTPIIPTGTVGIIDVEAIVKRPVVVTDEHGNDSIAIRHMMYLPISYDHRLIDGAYSAQFMQLVKKNLETWGKEQYGA